MLDLSFSTAETSVVFPELRNSRWHQRPVKVIILELTAAISKHRLIALVCGLALQLGGAADHKRPGVNMPDRLKRWLLIAAGTVCVGIGAVGIVVPVLPTTPFLLLAAVCYTRASKRLYTALLNNRLVGSYLTNYLEGRGMTRRSKVWTLSLLWGGIALAAALTTDSLGVRILLATVLCGVTAHILTVGTVRTDARVPTASQPE